MRGQQCMHCLHLMRRDDPMCVGGLIFFLGIVLHLYVLLFFSFSLFAGGALIPCLFLSDSFPTIRAADSI